MKMTREMRRAHTMIDVLAGIGIMVLLGSLALPAIQHSRDLSRIASCTNNLRQIGLGVQSYETGFGIVPGNYNAKWTVGLAEFAGEPGKYGMFVHERDSSVFPNAPLGQLEWSLFRCPSQVNLRVASNNWIVSHYAFSENALAVRFAEVTDGLSNTGLCFECDARVMLTLFGGPSHFISREPIHGRARGLLLMCDGRVERMSLAIDDVVLEGIRTIDGAEIVHDFR